MEALPDFLWRVASEGQGEKRVISMQPVRGKARSRSSSSVIENEPAWSPEAISAPAWPMHVPFALAGMSAFHALSLDAAC